MAYPENSGEKYTLEDVQYIRENKSKSNGEIGEALGRTPHAIARKRQSLGLLTPTEKQYQVNTKREEAAELIAPLWPNMTVTAIAKHTGLTYELVRSVAAELGLQRTRSQAQAIRADREWGGEIAELKPKGFTKKQLAWAEKMRTFPMPGEPEKYPERYRAWLTAKWEAGTIQTMAKDSGMVRS